MKERIVYVPVESLSVSSSLLVQNLECILDPDLWSMFLIPIFWRVVLFAGTTTTSSFVVILDTDLLERVLFAGTTTTSSFVVMYSRSGSVEYVLDTDLLESSIIRWNHHHFFVRRYSWYRSSWESIIRWNHHHFFVLPPYRSIITLHAWIINLKDKKKQYMIL